MFRIYISISMFRIVVVQTQQKTIINNRKCYGNITICKLIFIFLFPLVNIEILLSVLFLPSTSSYSSSATTAGAAATATGRPCRPWRPRPRP
jgi:hypothetical protein